MQRLVPYALTILALTPWMMAQHSRPNEIPRFEFYAGYLDAGEAQYNVFHFTQPGANIVFTDDFGTKRGVDLSATHNLTRLIGIKADFSAHFHYDEGPVNVAPCSGCVVSQTASINPRLYNFLIGPEFNFRNHTRFTPFVHTLVGIAHTNATFKTSGSGVNFAASTSETGFAMGLGPGFDIRIARRFSFRMILDYNPKWVGRDDDGGRSLLGDVRLSVGIVLR
ncbi:MAG TPA: outer membrane beta-barrel protein [Terriglobales bacterium]|jgi:opacity protein-like surface antigen|nr:outer membrane beta-barrel protein [Terriglobales bacterium]